MFTALLILNGKYTLKKQINAFLITYLQTTLRGTEKDTKWKGILNRCRHGPNTVVLKIDHIISGQSTEMTALTGHIFKAYGVKTTNISV